MKTIKQGFFTAWLIMLLLLFAWPHQANAQFMDSQTGLLQMPSGEMQPSGTFMITNNFVNKHSLPQENVWWGYNTFMYGFSLTFFSRVEVSYICVLYMGKADTKFWPEQTWGKYTNQDRHFAVRLQLLKEGEFGWDWMPSVVVGVSDPYTMGLYNPEEISQRPGNGHFNRMYICATKHFHTSAGDVSANLGYQYNLRNDYRYNAPCAAVTWSPVWFQNKWFNPKYILEFDSRTVNIGFISSIWDDRFEFMFELQNFQWVNFGARFKVNLKKIGSESFWSAIVKEYPPGRPFGPPGGYFMAQLQEKWEEMMEYR